MRLHFSETPRGTSLSVEIPNVGPDDNFIELIDKTSSPKELSSLLANVCQGFKHGRNPELCEQCVGGTYFLCGDDGQKTAVFKPLDEEPYCFNNPKGYTNASSWVVGSPSPPGYKEGVLVGEASVRECAAYVLDHEHFANVPATDLVVAKHSGFHCNEGDASFNWSPSLITSGADIGRKANNVKLGSFQEFRQHDGDFDEMSPRDIAEFPALQIQKLAVLDIRLFNTDRHGGNLLYKLGPTGRKSATLIPIDHGFTLPSTLDEALFVWLDWPQVACKMLPEIKAYIAELDVEADIALLEEKFPGAFGEEHFWVMRLASLVLQKGAAADMSLAAIGAMMSRLDFSQPSCLELLVEKARASSKGRPDLSLVNALLDECLQNASALEAAKCVHVWRPFDMDCFPDDD